MFTPEQYAVNVETVPGSGARVEFAIRLPGQGNADQALWLPIDAKFPREDYERLLDAHDRADAPAVELAAKALEQALLTQRLRSGVRPEDFKKSSNMGVSGSRAVKDSSDQTKSYDMPLVEARITPYRPSGRGLDRKQCISLSPRSCRIVEGRVP